MPVPAGAGGRRIPDGRQGPGRIPVSQLKALDLAVARRAAGFLPGERRAPGTGLGTELARLRAYEVGDDVRQLDPAASARTGVPHVRLQVPERTPTTWLVLDVSASMAFGTARRLKSDVAEGVALVVGRLATRRGGRLALVTFGAPAPRRLPPRGGSGALAGLRRALAEGVAADGVHEPGGLARALARVVRAARTPGLVVVVSDFREADPGVGGEIGPGDGAADSLARRAAAGRRGAPAPRVDGARVDRAGRTPRAALSWERPLGALATRHSVLAVEILDPRETELPAVGTLALVDPETGERIEVDSGRRALRRRFAEAEAARRDELAARLERVRADHVALRTDEDWMRVLGRRLR